MHPEDIALSYDQLAQHWHGPEFDRTNGIEQHQRALSFSPKLSANQPRRAIDVGCGSSGRIIQLLIDQGYVVEGLDISSRMLELAQTRHPTVTFHQADICTWTPVETYDFISAC